MQKQPFIYPESLFESDRVQDPAWTCVRTRPRWEKRFAAWLRAASLPHFLPVVVRRTRSYRKSRISELPLFPGYVFVRGIHTKGDFSRSASVAYVLNPRSSQEAHEVDDTLESVWRVLNEGREVSPVQRLTPGERVEVVAGPMMGTSGTFVREGTNGKLIVWLDLLGVGVAAELDDATLIERVI